MPEFVKKKYIQEIELRAFSRSNQRDMKRGALKREGTAAFDMYSGRSDRQPLENISTSKDQVFQGFLQSMSDRSSVLVVIGAGTAAWTYLHTKATQLEHSHVLVLGQHGYWAEAKHRLAQPGHMLALPCGMSEKFINPQEENKSRKVLAYLHSEDYQKKLKEFIRTTTQLIQRKRHIFHDKQAFVTEIKKDEFRQKYTFSIGLRDGRSIGANQVVVATGVGPERSLLTNLQEMHLEDRKKKGDIENKILSYTDVFSTAEKRFTGKRIAIYGGGATSAWAAEVVQEQQGDLVGWFARSFDKMRKEDPRLSEILGHTTSKRQIAEISNIQCMENDGNSMLCIKLNSTVNAGNRESQSDGTKNIAINAHYLLNCIGQNQHEKGKNGLPEIFSKELYGTIEPLLDSSRLDSNGSRRMLGWATPSRNILIIGAAQETFNTQKQRVKQPATSDSNPKSGQVRTTIPAIVSNICSLTNYMPFHQDTNESVPVMLGLNLNIMNATQLAVYFTIRYAYRTPAEEAQKIEEAVTSLIAERSKTDFGLDDIQINRLLQNFFRDANCCPLIHDPHSRDHSARFLDNKRNDSLNTGGIAVSGSITTIGVAGMSVGAAGTVTIAAALVTAGAAVTVSAVALLVALISVSAVALIIGVAFMVKFIKNKLDALAFSRKHKPKQEKIDTAGEALKTMSREGRVDHHSLQQYKGLKQGLLGSICRLARVEKPSVSQGADPAGSYFAPE